MSGFIHQGTGGSKGSQDKGTLVLLEHQSHWLEQFVLPGLAVSFACAVLLLARNFVLFFAPFRVIPWWTVAIGTMATLEGVYMSGVFIKTRAPFTARLLELLLVLASIYVPIRLALGLGYPWLSLAAFKAPDVYIPVFVVLYGWYLGGSFGSQFVRLGSLVDLIGDQRAATLSWEQEALMGAYNVESSRASAVLQFTRKSLFYLFVFAILSAVASEANPARYQAISGFRWSTALGFTVLLFSGFSLQGFIYLYRLQTIWKESGVRVSSGLPRQWMKALLYLVAGIAVLGLLFPADISPISFSQAAGLFVRMMSPLVDMNFGLVSGGGGEQPASPPRSFTSPEPGKMDWAALLSMIMMVTLSVVAGLAILAFAGFLLVTFLQDEVERFRGLRRLAVFVYLWTKRLWARIKAYLRTVVRWGNRVARSVGHRKNPGELGAFHFSQGAEDVIPTSTARYIRRLYVLMIRAGVDRGVPCRRSTTPSEFSQLFKGTLTSGREAVDQLTKVYLEARYSNHSLKATLKAISRAAWDQIVQAMQLSSRDKGQNLAPRRKRL